MSRAPHPAVHTAIASFPSCVCPSPPLFSQPTSTRRLCFVYLTPVKCARVLMSPHVLCFPLSCLNVCSFVCVTRWIMTACGTPWTACAQLCHARFVLLCLLRLSVFRSFPVLVSVLLLPLPLLACVPPEFDVVFFRVQVVFVAVALCARLVLFPSHHEIHDLLPVICSRDGAIRTVPSWHTVQLREKNGAVVGRCRYPRHRRPWQHPPALLRG